MNRYALSHLAEGALLAGLKMSLASERQSLALVLAHMAEVETRELYKPAGYSSMHVYCVHELHLSKDAANKRIRAARTARDFPAAFEKVEQGALRLTSLLILSSHLTAENAVELMAAAAFRSDFEVKEILSERFPQTPVPTTIEPIAEAQTLAEQQQCDRAPEQVAAQPLQSVVNPLQVKPIAPGLYKAQLTMSRAMRDKLRRAKDLLGYRRVTPDEAEILEMGLDLLVARLEKQKFGATDHPRAARASRSTRRISNNVKREVWERDGGQCTFVSEDGTRCPETRGLEWDHIKPVARGGDSSASNIRLRCRPHNQLEAERTYGKQFMRNKREDAKAAAAKRRAEKEAKKAAAEALDNDVLMPGLRGLGYTRAEARFALSECGPMEGHGLQARLKRCLAILMPPHLRSSRSAAPDTAMAASGTAVAASV